MSEPQVPEGKPMTLQVALESLDRIIGRMVMTGDPAANEAFQSLVVLQKELSRRSSSRGEPAAATADLPIFIESWLRSAAEEWPGASIADRIEECVAFVRLRESHFGAPGEATEIRGTFVSYERSHMHAGYSLVTVRVPSEPFFALNLPLEAPLNLAARSSSGPSSTSEDTKRLDWLEANGREVLRPYEVGELVRDAERWCVTDRLGDDGPPFKTMREAIDAALSSSPSSTEKNNG
jgi:hypothetical protein